MTFRQQLFVAVVCGIIFGLLGIVASDHQRTAHAAGVEESLHVVAKLNVQPQQTQCYYTTLQGSRRPILVCPFPIPYKQQPRQSFEQRLIPPRGAGLWYGD